MKEFFQYLIEEYSEPVVGYPEDHRRLTLISRKEDVCWISIFYLFYKAWIFFSTNTTTWGWRDPYLTQFQQRVAELVPSESYFYQVANFLIFFNKNRFGGKNFHIYSQSHKAHNAPNA